MKWLDNLTRNLPGEAADTRFVARAPAPVDARRQDTAEDCGEPTPPRAPGPARLALAVPDSPHAAGQPSCTLVSQDAGLVDQLAGIALSAAVRIHHCTSAAQYEQLHPSGPVLWGADLLGELEVSAGLDCDVLVGRPPDSEELWLVASTRPHARVAVLPHAAGWLGEYLGQWALRSGHGHTIVFSALAGGIGTSTLACLLAHAGTLSGLQSLVVDLDPFSGSLWPMLSWQATAGVGWEQLQGSGGTLAAHQFAEVLARAQETSVLTWQHEPASFPIDEALMVRVLAAARQAFDLVVIDAGRHLHPLASVLEQFADRRVVTGQAEHLGRIRHLRADFISCSSPAAPTPSGAVDARLLGHFPPDSRLASRIQRSDLLQALHSRRLRRRLADYDLLPRLATVRP